MPSFPRPKPEYNYSLEEEKKNMEAWITLRKVPRPNRPGKLLMGSWNIANLGEQKRTEKDLKLIAHLLSRFDLVAVQEIKAGYANFEKIVGFMGKEFDFIMSDAGGNNERLGYIYRTKKVVLGKLFAEVAIPERNYPKLMVNVPWTYYKERRIEVFYKHRFTAFDRNPFIGTFGSGKLDFMVANVHLYYGAPKNSKTTKDRAKYARRVLEIYTLSRWAKKRATTETSYDNDVILVGDMNIPEMKSTDDAFKALKRSGLLPSDYFSKTGGSNLNGKKTYDQLAVTPGTLEKKVLGYNVFDFDNGIFKSKWDQVKTKSNADLLFNAYMRAYISDHRPLWIQFDVK